MKTLPMKNLVGTILFTCISAGLVSAQNSTASANDASDVAALEQLAQDFGDAIKDADSDKFNQVLSEDWQSVGVSGKVLTREGFLTDLKAGYHKLESFKLGPMYVKVLGDVGVIQGTVTEKRTDRGEDTSGYGSFMDVCVKREDKWVIVRSASSWVKSKP
ncbi:MAG: nuclear transport factor 2 family protein [Chthoniobacterales bacterium]